MGEMEQSSRPCSQQFPEATWIYSAWEVIARVIVFENIALELMSLNLNTDAKTGTSENCRARERIFYVS